MASANLIFCILPYHSETFTLLTMRGTVQLAIQAVITKAKPFSVPWLNNRKLPRA